MCKVASIFIISQKCDDDDDGNVYILFSRRYFSLIRYGKRLNY